MRIFRDCSLVASLNNKTTIDERDVIVVRQILGDYSKHNTWGTGYQERIQETRMTPEETVTSKAGYKKNSRIGRITGRSTRKTEENNPKKTLRKS